MGVGGIGQHHNQNQPGLISGKQIQTVESCELIKFNCIISLSFSTLAHMRIYYNINNENKVQIHWTYDRSLAEHMTHTYNWMEKNKLYKKNGNDRIRLLINSNNNNNNEQLEYKLILVIPGIVFFLRLRCLVGEQTEWESGHDNNELKKK